MINKTSHSDHLFAFDKIRICKIFEFLQYSFVGTFITMTFITIISLVKKRNKDLLKILDYNYENNLIINYILFTTKISIKVFFCVLMIFYIRKIILLFPSIPSMIVKDFKPLTTLDYTIKVCTIFIVLQLFYGLKDDFSIYYEVLYNEKQKRKTLESTNMNFASLYKLI